MRGNDVDSIIDFLCPQSNKYTPVSITWELTNRCNFNCKFCYINCNGISYLPFPSLELCMDIIDELVHAGMLFCTLTGGECLLHPKFEEIYTYLKQKGVLVSVFTNASLVNESILSLFKALPPYKIEISIYGISEDSFIGTTGQDGSVSKTVLDNILSLSGLGLQVICKTPLNTLTEGEMPIIKEWCNANKIPFYNSPEILDTYSGESNDRYAVSEDIAKEYEERRINHLAKKTCREYGRKKAFDCSAGKSHAFISYNMKIHPCSSFFGINSYSFSIEQYGISSALQHLNNRISNVRGVPLAHCNGCNYNDVCSRCIVDEIRDQEEWTTKCKSFAESIQNRFSI